MLCVRCDCDACCRQRIWCDWRRAYWSCAEVADWVAEAESVGYVIHGVVVCFVVVFVVFILLREGVILLRCGGAVVRMGVVCEM